jgi:hypothetical protein
MDYFRLFNEEAAVKDHRMDSFLSYWGEIQGVASILHNSCFFQSLDGCFWKLGLIVLLQTPICPLIGILSYSPYGLNLHNSFFRSLDGHF